jgi:lambda family phage tail tape measure protein
VADLDFSVNADTSGAQRNLQRLEKSIGGITSSMNGLKAVIAGVGFSAIINSSIRMAAAMNDLSGNTNIAISSILGLSRAIVDNGGSADIAQKGIQKFAQTIGAAVSGSAEAQRAFSEIGVSINDLATLSETDLLAKTVAGLGRIEDSTKRIRLQTQAFGKEFGQVNIAGAAAGFTASVAASTRYEAAIKAAGIAQDNANKNLQNFQIAVLDALRPLTEFVSAINISVDGFRQFLQAVLAVGAVLVSVFIGSKIVAAIKIFYVTLLAVGGAAKNLAGLFVNLYKQFGLITTEIGKAGGAFSRIKIIMGALWSAMTTILMPAFKALKVLVIPILASVAAYWGYIQESTTSAIQSVKDYINAASRIVGLGNVFDARDPRENFPGRGAPSEIANREAAEKQNQALREVNDALAKKRAEIQKVSQAFREQNNQIIDSINLEKSFIGKSEEFIEVERAREEILNRAANETAKLREMKKMLTADESALAAVYDQQIAKISAAAQVDAERVAQSLTGLQGLRQLEQARQQDIQNTTKAIEDQILRQQSLGDIIRQANQLAATATEQKSSMRAPGLSSIQQQILDIQESARNAASEAARSFAAQFDDGGEGLTPERAKELADGLDQIANAYKRVADAQTGLAQKGYDTSRLFETGWKEAFAKFNEDANNAAMAAANLFNKTTKGMEDAIVNFAKTGKFEFKNLVNVILEELLRIQIQKTFASLLGGLSGGGGFLAGFGKLLGFANGGIIPTNSPVLVGERGPELLVGASGNRVIPNDQLGGTQVTYNINAVDAPSFKQMIANDPSFIYAVTEQGRRRAPATRR